VGTGGNRLGRVDLSIVREPGTKLPKIPGTALHGAIRQYAAIRYESLRCAGAGQVDKSKGKEGHHRDGQCPVCYTFGYLRGEDGGQSGAVSIGDARLLLFPVYSLAGPVWVTCPSVLREHNISASVSNDKLKGKVGKEHLNLGWLMLPKEEGEFTLPDAVVPEIKERAVLVSDKLFSQIVNSNLEVRTSVSIDPETGAAKDKALFTYEAIPRTAILWLDVVEDDFSNKFPKEHEKAKELGHQKPLDVVQAGLKLAEHLGIGGMGTRGFGRVRLLNEEVKP
jgi:CRISPR-associated protein Cmr4